MAAPGNRATGRPRPTRAEVRQALLDAALAEFTQVGYGEATVESIARRAGLTKGAVYGNFDGKAGLFLALLGPEWANRASFFDGLCGEPGDPQASLRRMAEVVHRQAGKLGPTLLVAEGRAHAARSPALALQFAEVRTDVVDELVPLLQAELERVGLAPAGTIHETLYAIVALINGLAMERVGKTESVVSVELIERILRALVVVVD